MQKSSGFAKIPMTEKTYQGQSDRSPCHIQKSGSLSEKSLLPINISNSLQQQASNTSSQINSVHSSASEPVCRICHGMSNTEQLMSLCFCSGSIGQMHVSCLQRWLGSSNKTQCELCHFNFVMERKPKPFYVYLANPGSSEDRCRLIFDIICICLLLPTTLTVVSMCIYGASLFHPHRAEFIGILMLATFLFALFTVWFVICVRLNIHKWRKWKQFNQEVKLKCSPSLEICGNKDRSSETSIQSKDTTSQGSQMGVKISSIEIKVITEGHEEYSTTNKHFMESIVSLQKVTLEKPALQCVSRPFNTSFHSHTDTPDVLQTRQISAWSGEICRMQTTRNCASTSSSPGEHRCKVTPRAVGAHSPPNRKYSLTPTTEESRYLESLRISSSPENSSGVPCSPNVLSGTPFPGPGKGNIPRFNDNDTSIVCPKRSYV